MFTVPKFLSAPKKGDGGMTLLEVVVGLAILGLMAGAIYAIVSGSLEATASLAATQTEDRRMETFLHRTRQALTHFPAGATLELKLLENDPLRQELIIRNVPDAYIWGPNSRWEKSVVTLTARPWEEERKNKKAPRSSQKNEGLPPDYFSLAMSVPDFFRTTDEGEPVPESPVQSRQGNQFLKPDQQGRFWMDLLPEIDRVEWRFYNSAKKLWLEQSPAVRPPLVELLLFLPGRTTPVRSVFATS